MMQAEETTPELPPLPDNYELTITDPEKTGIRLFRLADKQTGIVTTFIEFNKEFDIHAAIAWAGARTSRTDDSYESIYSEIHEASKAGRYQAGEKLMKVFLNYGHASVADMSPIMIGIENIPMLEAFFIFDHTSVNAGQELSTRYVEISDLGVPEIQDLLDLESLEGEQKEKIQNLWGKIQDNCSRQYTKWTSLIKPRIEKFIEDGGKKPSKDTVNARTLDIARMWIPVGASTSMISLSSTRDWVNMIKQLRENESPISDSIADQILVTLNLKNYSEGESLQADIGRLTKHHEGTFTVNQNLKNLQELILTIPEFSDLVDQPISHEPKSSPNKAKILNLDTNYSPGTLLAAEYISVLFPNIDEEAILEKLVALDDNLKGEIGRIILDGHNHHDLLKNAADVRGTLVVVETALAYLRDLNRHRALGRLMHLLETRNTDAIVYQGFNQNFALNNSDYLKDLSPMWEEDMAQHYQMIFEFYEVLKESLGDNLDSKILNYILPLGHQVKAHFSGPLLQFDYMLSLRISLGGDFGYRDTAHQILELFRQDPFLVNMLERIERPDPNNLNQVTGRS